MWPDSTLISKPEGRSFLGEDSPGEPGPPWEEPETPEHASRGEGRRREGRLQTGVPANRGAAGRDPEQDPPVWAFLCWHLYGESSRTGESWSVGCVSSQAHREPFLGWKCPAETQIHTDSHLTRVPPKGSEPDSRGPGGVLDWVQKWGNTQTWLQKAA